MFNFSEGLLHFLNKYLIYDAPIAIKSTDG